MIRMTPDDLEIYIQKARKERQDIINILKEETDSVNVLRAMSGMKGNLHYRPFRFDEEQKNQWFYVGGLRSCYQDWYAGMKIHSHRTRTGVFTEVMLIEDNIGINLMTKCRAIMNRIEYKLRNERQKPGYRDFIIRINEPEELRKFFKIFMKVENIE